MPQNSGGKCVLTENIVKMQKIYGAIEKNAGRIMTKKSYDQSGPTFFRWYFPLALFISPNSICFPEQEGKKQQEKKFKK